MFSEVTLLALVGSCTLPLPWDNTSFCVVLSACAACILVPTPFILSVSVFESDSDADLRGPVPVYRPRYVCDLACKRCSYAEGVC